MSNKNSLLYTGLLCLGIFGGIALNVRESNNLTNFPLYITKSKLETKLDSLEDKKNYWIALKDSSELRDLANSFISKYDKQIKNSLDSISQIEANPEFKRLERKATKILYSNGARFIYGSFIAAFLGLYFHSRNTERKPKQEL